MKYHVVITGWGQDALTFLEDPESDCIIIFNDDAPAELADLSVLHTKSELLDVPALGDTVVIGKKIFEVTAVGAEVKSTLRNMGHCTFVFSGADTPERPGCIMLKGDEKLLASDIQVGNTIEIY